MNAWEEEMIPLTRGLINDVDDTNYTYSDNQVIKFIIYAAHLNLSDITFTNTYTVDISKLSISPDPTTLSTIDSAFINFTCIKAAILMLKGELKTDASKAVSVSDGPSSIDYREVYKAKKQICDDMIEAFEMAKVRAMIGDLSSGLAILTPFTQEVLYSDNTRGV